MFFQGISSDDVVYTSIVFFSLSFWKHFLVKKVNVTFGNFSGFEALFFNLTLTLLCLFWMLVVYVLRFCFVVLYLFCM